MVQSFDQINSFLVIVIYGSLILLSFLLVANIPKVNKKANLLFGIFLFLWSTFWMEEIFELTDLSGMGAETIVSLRLLQFFTPLFFYYGTLFFTNPDYKLGKKELVYLVLPILYFVGLIMDASTAESDLLPIILNVLIIIHSFYFIILSYLRIKEHKKKINLIASNTTEIDLRWLEYIIIALLVLSVFIGVYNVLFTLADLNFFANLFCLIIVYFVAINALRQKEIFVLDEIQREQIFASNKEQTAEKRKLLSDEDLENLKIKLTSVMDANKPFLDPELSLMQLSNIIDITPHQLSYLINEGFGENFFMYVNKYRVTQVKEYLNDDKKKNLAILGIAFESGFNSKTSFYNTFKKITAMTPSEYIKKSS